MNKEDLCKIIMEKSISSISVAVINLRLCLGPALKAYQFSTVVEASALIYSSVPFIRRTSIVESHSQWLLWHVTWQRLLKLEWWYVFPFYYIFFLSLIFFRKNAKQHQDKHQICIKFNASLHPMSSLHIFLFSIYHISYSPTAVTRFPKPVTSVIFIHHFHTRDQIILSYSSVNLLTFLVLYEIAYNMKSKYLWTYGYLFLFELFWALVFEP